MLEIAASRPERVRGIDEVDPKIESAVDAGGGAIAIDADAKDIAGHGVPYASIGFGAKGTAVLSCGMTAILHGLFTLAEGVSEAEFMPTFEAFYRHLHEQGFARSYRLMRRQPLPGRFGAALPPFELHVEIEFASLAADAACYEYVARDEEPVRSLHRAMNSKVRRGAAHFFLTAP